MCHHSARRDFITRLPETQQTDLTGGRVPRKSERMCWINIIKDTNINKVFYAMVRFSQIDIKKFKGRVITYRWGWGNRQIMISLDI